MQENAGLQRVWKTLSKMVMVVVSGGVIIVECGFLLVFCLLVASTSLHIIIVKSLLFLLNEPQFQSWLPHNPWFIMLSWVPHSLYEKKTRRRDLQRLVQTQGREAFRECDRRVFLG